jgi:acyl carrier protein
MTPTTMNPNDRRIDTFDELIDLLSTEFKVDLSAIDLDSELVDFGLDSLALVDLMFTVEEHFDIDLPNETSRFRTVRQLIGLIDQLRLPRAA